MDVIGSDFCWSVTAASGFVVCDSGDPVVDPHEVGIIGESGYDLDCTMPLNGSSYPVDGHRALLRGSVAPVGYFIQGLVEVVDG
jgi:hypothetical protein